MLVTRGSDGPKPWDIPPFQIYDSPHLITLPYVCYQETNGDTYLVGTEGQDQPVHYWPVHLGLAAPVKGVQVDDNNVGFLTEDLTFNFALAQVLEGLNNPSTLAEVSCLLRSSGLKVRRAQVDFATS